MGSMNAFLKWHARPEQMYVDEAARTFVRTRQTRLSMAPSPAQLALFSVWSMMWASMNALLGVHHRPHGEPLAPERRRSNNTTQKTKKVACKRLHKHNTGPVFDVRRAADVRGHA